MQKNSKIYVAGHKGLVGSALMRCLRDNGYHNIITRTHEKLDLCNQKEVLAFFAETNPEYCFMAAAKVGGIHANNNYPADFIYQNLSIQTNVIHAAKITGIKRLLFLGSSCIYPRDCDQPMKEEHLLSAPLEETNRPYAIAKISGIEMCWSYNRQYGSQFLAVMPTNLYGPNDSYHLKNSHVLPALIRKFHLAKLSQKNDFRGIQKDQERHGNIPADTLRAIGISDDLSSRTKREVSVALWGSGDVKREFLHCDDMADACVFLMRKEDAVFSEFVNPKQCPLVNIGYGSDLTIKDLVNIVKTVVGIDCGVIWDKSMPDGTKQKLLDVSKMKQWGWQSKIGLEDGIASVYQNYCAAMPESG